MDWSTISLDSEDKTMDYRQIKKQANEILKNKTAGYLRLSAHMETTITTTIYNISLLA